jgi:hypothetical protein
MSIKRKVLTSVTTAAMLAGLFGSAFVPSAMGAGRASAAYTPVKSLTDITYGALLQETTSTSDETVYWEASANVVTGVPAGATDASTGAVIHYEINRADGTSTGANIESKMDLKATSSSSLIKLAWMYDESATAETDCEDADLDLNAGTAGVGWSTTDTVEQVDGAAGVYDLCVYSNGKPGTATITVVANGVTLPVVTIVTLGDLASLTLSAAKGYLSVAEGNGAVSTFWKLIGKDSAGNVLNGPTRGVSPVDLNEYVDGDANPDTDADSAPDHKSGVSALDIISGNGADDGAVTASGLANDSETIYTLPANVCTSETYTGAGDGDKGNSFTVAVSAASDGDTIVSNSVTILCTGGAVEAKVTGVAATAVAGGTTYKEDGVAASIYVQASVVDKAGRAIGVGLDLTSGTVADGFNIGIDGTEDGDLTFAEETTSLTSTGGKFTLGTITVTDETAKKHKYVIELESTDFYGYNVDGDDAVAKTYNLYYTATDADASPIVPTVTKNAAKTRATITVDCGVTDSLAVVFWDVELANGNLIEYSRKANIDGVVKLTLNRRNTTVRVQAYCTDGDSEVKSVRFR